MINKVNKFSGIQAHIYLDKVYNKRSAHGFVMGLPFKLDFFMTLLWVIKEYLKPITKKYRNK
jgi:hypothetical protein